MKKSLLVSLLCLISACTTLTGHERLVLRDLKSDGISVENPTGMWEKPASPLLAGVLNLLPGFGNFYLGMGNAADGSQSIYGVVNLLLWPLSPIWGIPQAVIDAKTINERDLVFIMNTQQTVKMNGLKDRKKPLQKKKWKEKSVLREENGGKK